MKNIVLIVLVLLAFSTEIFSKEIEKEHAYVEANLYQLTGSLISSNIYLTYMSIDMLFINANNYSNEEKHVICNSIKQGLAQTKKDFENINTFVDYDSKEKFENYVNRLYDSLLKDLKLLRQYFEDNEGVTRDKFLSNHKKIWKLLSQNPEGKTDEKD